MHHIHGDLHHIQGQRICCGRRWRGREAQEEKDVGGEARTHEGRQLAEADERGAGPGGGKDACGKGGAHRVNKSESERRVGTAQTRRPLATPGAPVPKMKSIEVVKPRPKTRKPKSQA